MDSQLKRKIIEIIEEDKAKYTNFSLNNDILLFTYAGRRYMCDLSNDDDWYLRILTPGRRIYDDVSSNARQLLELNGKYKVGKIAVINDYVWLCAEIFVGSVDNIDKVFSRIIRMLGSMRDEFNTLVHES